MSRLVFSHEQPERFTVGTVGVPGERAFFIQVSSSQGLNTIAVEKGQVEALAIRLRDLLVDLRRGGLASLDELSLPPVVDNAQLDFPIEEDFQAGVIGFTWEASTQRVMIELQALTEMADQELYGVDSDLGDIEDPPDLVRVALRLYQIRGFIERAEAVVSSGRQPCPFCGLPINVDGHLCPRANGYRR